MDTRSAVIVTVITLLEVQLLILIGFLVTTNMNHTQNLEGRIVVLEEHLHHISVEPSPLNIPIPRPGQLGEKGAKN